MALTADQLAQLRRMVADITGEMWDDALLQAAAEAFVNTDGTYNLRSLSASLWEEKAAEWATLVATSESGSSRAAQQQFDHAIEMAKRFGATDGSSGTDETNYPMNTKMVRATREG